MKLVEAKDEAEGLVDEIRKRIKALTDSTKLKKTLHAQLEMAESLMKRNDTEGALDHLRDLQEKIERAEESIEAEPVAYGLLFVEIAYLVVLLFLAYATYRWPGYSLWAGFVTPHTQAAWFGALGGVAVALYGLYTHVQQRDFDRGYALWYICKPMIGGIFGWFAFLIYYVGIISVQGLDTQSPSFRPELPFIISFLAGFSERFVLRLIDRLMSVLLTPAEEKGQKKGEKKEAKPKG